MYLKRLTYQEFVESGISPPVARFLTSSEHPIADFDILVRPVHCNWEYDVPADASNVIGLWDENSDPVVRWQRNGVIEFVWLFHDDPGIDVVATSEQGLLADLFLKYHEMECDPARPQDQLDKLMRDFGIYTGFRGTERLLDLLNNYAGDEEFDREYAALIASL